MRCDDRHSDYLRDESRRIGSAEEIYFPRDADELAALLARLRDAGTRWTVQGARTGLYGAAVPGGGAIVNLSAMSGIHGMNGTPEGGFAVTVAAGTTLSAVREFCRTRRADTARWDEASRRALARFATAGKWFFPVEPSEESATVGGIFATGAKGISLRQFGPTHEHVDAARTIDGDIAAALHLRLVPTPAERWGLFFFFAEAAAARAFALGVSLEMAEVDCVLFHAGVLSLIQCYRRHVAALKELPEFPAGMQHGVYVELSGQEDDGRLELLLERFSGLGGQDEDTWAESGPAMEKLRLPYHAALELEGMRFDELRRGAPGLVRQCREFAVPLAGYDAFLRRCSEESASAGAEALLFSCAPRGHVHLGLMAGDSEAAERAGEAFATLTDYAVSLGGGLAKEFGQLP